MRVCGVCVCLYVCVCGVRARVCIAWVSVCIGVCVCVRACVCVCLPVCLCLSTHLSDSYTKVFKGYRELEKFVIFYFYLNTNGENRNFVQASPQCQPERSVPKFGVFGKVMSDCRHC